MKKLLFLSLILGIGFTSCTKEETVQPQQIVKLQTNVLKDTYWKNNLDLLEFTQDTMFEYSEPLNTTYVSSYIINDSMLLVTNHYSIKNGVKRNLTNSYFEYYYKVSNDSLYFNNAFKGKKY
mgnify:CR=1 FL=1